MQRIFVGDVQGCADELEEILDRAERAFGADFEVGLVGDLINRGPYNGRVLARVRELCEAGRAHPVLGNHEVSFLRVALGLRQLRPDDTFQDLLEGSRREEWIDWLRSWPVAKQGRLGVQPFALVHAAVAPEWSLGALAEAARCVEERLRGSRTEASRLLAASPGDDRDADTLARITRCRSIDAHGRWSSEPPRSPEDAWHVRWRAAGRGYGIVYGHWSLQGLHVAPGLRGLDTGCVYHGHGRDGFLTAWVPDPAPERPFAIPDEHFWRVRAHRRYWRGDVSGDSG
jgi:bis(5'-nucleosyl)-tetraphosphatase (symmetrical)